GGTGGGDGGTGGGGGVMPVDGGTIAGGETCEMAVVVAGPATVFSGTTTGLMSNYDAARTASGSGCNGYTRHPGADAVYQITVPARSRLTATVQGQGGDGTSMANPAYDPAIYLVATPPANCAVADADGGVQATCIAASADPLDSAADLLGAETVTWKNTDTNPVDVFLVIESGWDTMVNGLDTDFDGTDDAWATGQGDFSATVIVAPLPPVPSNDTCTGAATLNTSGTATNGTTQGANPDLTFDANTTCFDTTDLGDVFYSVSIPAGQRLTVGATTQAADTAITVNVFEGACMNVATCRSGSSNMAGTAASTTYDNRGTAALPALVQVATADPNDLGADFSITATLANIPPPPANDACTAAATLAANTSTPGTFDGATADAFLDPNAMVCADGRNGAMKDVFYTLMVPAGNRANITVTPSASVDAVLNVTNAPGTCTGVTTCLEGEDSGGDGDAERVRYDNTTGAPVTLLLHVGSWDDVEGAFTIQADVAPIPPPPGNDTCAAPVALTSGTTVNGTTVSATPDMLYGASPMVCVATSTPRKDVFYTLAVPATKMATIVVTPDASMDAFVNVIDSTAGCTGVATCLAGMDNGFTGGAETVMYTNSGTATVTLLIQVGDYYGVEAPFTILATVTP
ncbi:MAG: hypothetical protein AB1938_06860, partial [Myxococcota bacterium]